MSKKILRVGILIFVAVSISFNTAQYAYAQTPCGSITGEDGIIVPIVTCSNPFNSDIVTTSNGQLTIDGQSVTDGGLITVQLGQPLLVSTQFSQPVFTYNIDFYKNVGQDFLFKGQINLFLNQNINFAEAGTYTAVIIVDSNPPILVEQTFWQKLASFILPTVYAYYPGFLEVKSITFDVVDAALPAPVATSSVLFLPGIQASRLYTNGIFGTENKIWEPNINADVEKLAMTSVGASINNIYTRDVIDSVFGINIYNDFLLFLQNQKDAGNISDWRAFAYDWRYDVFDIVQNGTQYEASTQNPITILENLASTNNSKVTIVAHSNGGLLAKALMIELEVQGKSNLVDKIIFLASPQIGTPKTIGTILHGYDQEKVGGYVVNDETARDVIANMPGAYGLLPSANYFANSTPVIEFSNTPNTQTWRNTYGPTIDTINELTAFMTDSSGGRAVPADINQPSVANASMMQNALDRHSFNLDTWQAPTNVAVYEIVGTGLGTVDYFTYKNFQKKQCFLGFLNCTVVDYLEPVPHITQRGDQTVVVQSAQAYSGIKKTYYVDLEKIRTDDNYKFVTHVGMGESPLVQSLITSVFNNQTPTIQYISETEPSYTTALDVISVHSPVAISLRDSLGRTVEKIGVGSSTRIITDIPGSEYVEFADGKYIVVPSITDYTAIIEGQAEGSYTLVVQRTDGPNTLTLSEYSLATTTPSLRATFSKSNGIFGLLSSDLDGDGIIDTQATLDGILIDIEHIDDDDEDDKNEDGDKKDKTDNKKDKHKEKDRDKKSKKKQSHRD